MSANGTEPGQDGPDGMADAVRSQRRRQQRWLSEGEPSMARYVGQIGVLGWMIVAPTLAGLFLGRWLDLTFGTRIFWSGPLLILGLTAGCWGAWRWMHRQ